MLRSVRHAISVPVLFLLALGGCDRTRGDTNEGVDTKPPVLIPPSVEQPTLNDGPPPVSASDPPPVAVEPAPPGRCDPNYTPCVPIDSDVDCAGGKGDGPSYVVGPVRVIGSDPYKLDRDRDGVACEN